MADEKSTVAQNDIVEGLRALGISEGDTIFFHSSLSSFGHVEGGAETVVGGLLEVLGEGGTLCAPTYRTFFNGGPEQVWDREQTPSAMGAISEAVRMHPGSLRSSHPVHPVNALGVHAEALTGDHSRDFSFDSPYWKLLELDAWIVFLGTGWGSCTIIHLLEELSEVRYRHWVDLKGTVVINGTPTTRSHPFLQRHPGVHNDFHPLGSLMEEGGAVKEVAIGDARVKAFRARDLLHTGYNALRRDPLCLVSEETKDRARLHLPNFNALLDERATQDLTFHAPENPTAKALSDVLRIVRADGEPEVEIRNRWEMPDGVILEDLRLRGGPNEMVPAMFAYPKGKRKPMPAAICLHGTSGISERLMVERFERRGAALWGWARELGRRGFASLAITQLVHPPRPEPSNGEWARLWPTYGLTSMGQLVGDVLFGVDFLRTRKEVDGDRISALGFSLGGIAAFYGFIVDDRIAAAVPFCGGVGSIRELIRKGATGYHSVYFYPPDLLGNELDHPNLVPAMTSRSLLVCGKQGDIGMPFAGLETFIKAAERGYADAGTAEKFKTFIQDGDHEMTPEAFEEASSWLKKQLG